MRAYRAILAARFRMMLQYRAAAAAGFGCQLFFGFMLVMVYEAFYRSSGAPQPMTIAQITSYVWLGQATFRILPWNPEADIRLIIRSGNVAYEMLRPVDLYLFWYSRSLANRAAPTLLRALPMFVTAALFLGLEAPASAAAGAGYLASLAGALFLACAISTLLSTTLLWTVAGEGAAAVTAAVVSLLSGIVIPLPLFPEWAQTTLALLPFRGVIDAPARIYTGSIPVSGLAGVLAHQVLWTLALVAIGRLVLSRGTRRLVVQGG